MEAMVERICGTGRFWAGSERVRSCGWWEWRINRERGSVERRERRVRAGETGMRLMEWTKKLVQCGMWGLRGETWGGVSHHPQCWGILGEFCVPSLIFCNLHILQHFFTYFKYHSLWRLEPKGCFLSTKQKIDWEEGLQNYLFVMSVSLNLSQSENLRDGVWEFIVTMMRHSGYVSFCMYGTCPKFMLVHIILVFCFLF